LFFLFVNVKVNNIIVTSNKKDEISDEMRFFMHKIAYNSTKLAIFDMKSTFCNKYIDKCIFPYQNAIFMSKNAEKCFDNAIFTF